MITICPGRRSHGFDGNPSLLTDDHQRSPKGPAPLPALAAEPWSFGALGALVVHTPAGPVELGPPQRRVLLLRLLAEDGRPVSPE
ncbi:hypothetical protein [Nonomuraea africana]|uniref:hypothetical protein n=1 Tax=Nonomuraea africana TaxID=46171 RepID=UPI0033C3F5FB